MLNVAAIMGRLTTDPELRHTANGFAVTSFTLAVDRSFANRDTGERQTDFIDVVAWRGTAEFVCRYFTKGQMMAVDGSIQTRTYEDRQGNKRKAVEIQANNVSFCGSKRETENSRNSNASYGGGSYYDQPSPAPAAPAFQEPAPAYSSGSTEDFEEILGDDDLPF